MGSSHRDQDRKKKDRKEDKRKQESKEDRQLRKAKEYIEEAKEVQSKQSSSRSHHRKSSRGQDDEKDDSKHRDKRHREDRSDESDNNDRRRHRKSHKSASRDNNDRDRKSSRKKDSKKRHKKESSSSRKSAKIQKPDKKDLVPLGEPLGRPPTQLLDAEKDYFAYHQQLFVYMYREEGLVFNDMTSEETHAAFARFSGRYNKGKLQAAYYDPKGLPPAAVDESKTTRHTWSFRTTDTENKSLQYLQEGVRKQTEFAGGIADSSGGVVPTARGAVVGAARQPEQPQQRTAQDRYGDQVANKRMREHVRTVGEEFGTGGKTHGRERQIEKRKEVADRTHGASRDRDGAPELTDDAIFGAEGGGDIGFRTALAREKERSTKRVDKRNARVVELQKKEDDKKQNMLKMLGLDGIKERIKIAPRNDA